MTRAALLAALALLLAASLLTPAPQMGGPVLQAPGGAHWLGTDELGQDVLLRLLAAVPHTLALAGAAGVLPVAIALAAAALFLWAPGWGRQAVLRAIDIAMLLPATLVMVVLAAFITPGLWGSIVLLSLLAWLDDYRVIATALQREALRESVQIARMYGATRRYLLRAHLLPPIWPVLQALMVQNARRSVMLGTGLVFLGLADPRMPSWGALLLEAQKYLHLDAFWWLLPPPVAALSALLLALHRLRPSEAR